jgi:dolichol-phosphate mannosyltransferase
MSAIVVVPTYNELENVGKLVEAIRNLPDKIHLLIVDDNSPDGTGRVVDELCQQYPGEVFAYHRERKQGLGRAYVAAFQHVLKNFNYAFIIQMDCDLSHDPVYIKDFLKAIQNADLVLGSRYLTGINVVNWDFKRLLLSKFASVYVRLVTGMPYTDLTGGFKCWRRTTLEALRLDRIFSMGYLFQVETTYRVWRARRFKIVETPIIFYERNRGRSKIHPRIILEALIGVIRLRFTRTRG